MDGARGAAPRRPNINFVHTMRIENENDHILNSGIMFD